MVNLHWLVLGRLSLQITAEPRFSYRPLITRSCSILGLRMECARDADGSVIDAMGRSTGHGALVFEGVGLRGRCRVQAPVRRAPDPRVRNTPTGWAGPRSGG